MAAKPEGSYRKIWKVRFDPSRQIELAMHRWRPG